MLKVYAIKKKDKYLIKGNFQTLVFRADSGYHIFSKQTSMVWATRKKAERRLEELRDQFSRHNLYTLDDVKIVELTEVLE